MQDTTAALFGLGADAVPDDVFSLLSRFHIGLGNEYIWGKKGASIAIGSTSQTVSVYSGNTVTVYYADSVKISNGAITLNNPSSFSITNGNSVSVDLTNKYFYTSANSNVYKAISVRSTSLASYVLNCYSVTIEEQTVGYVNSADQNAYPPDVEDGYTYTYFGQIGNKVRIATGSYIGTGKYGKSNPNSLTFDFDPKFLLIFEIITAGTSSDGYVAMMTPGSPCYWVSDNGLAGSNNVFWTKNTVSWFNNADRTNGLNAVYCIKYQLNKIDVTYNYIAIG